ncbi:RNA polymerase sigma factor [Kordia zhangzhouensis]|uniref:RNA polymerase sigma factor n=1 Tax=Kordia zhangzhouensis TaxID=1620405 RepID=UPI00062982B3|nr:sigma-70 family RNA polymerase sigma factor [Kordia zhangzhouensis]
MPKPLQENICNEGLFSSLFKKHYQSLYSYLYYKFGEYLNPEDKAQEAFTKLWQNCGKVSPAKAKSYVFTIGNNLMLNEVKHHKVVLQHQKIKPKSHTNESPEFVLQEKQYLEKLECAIANLTESERTAFLMNRVEGKKHKEIAAILDISTKAVEKRIYRALAKLREEIKEL